MLNGLVVRFNTFAGHISISAVVYPLFLLVDDSWFMTVFDSLSDHSTSTII